MPSNLSTLIDSPPIRHPTAQIYLFFIILFSTSASSLHFPQFLQRLLNLGGINTWTESRKTPPVCWSPFLPVPLRTPQNAPSFAAFHWRLKTEFRKLSSPGTTLALSHDYHHAPTISTVASSGLLAPPCSQGFWPGTEAKQTWLLRNWFGLSCMVCRRRLWCGAEKFWDFQLHFTFPHLITLEVLAYIIWDTSRSNSYWVGVDVYVCPPYLHVCRIFPA